MFHLSQVMSTLAFKAKSDRKQWWFS